MTDNELMHYGILGMKWGVRRYQNKDGSLTPAGRKRYDIGEQSNAKKETNNSSPKSSSEPKITPTRTGPRPASELTDQELRDFLNRVDLERRYNAIVNPEPKPKEKSPVAKFVGDVLYNSGKNVATTFVTKKLTDLVMGKDDKKDKKDDSDDGGGKKNKNKVNERLDSIEKMLREMNGKNQNNSQSDSKSESSSESVKKGFLQTIASSLGDSVTVNAEVRARADHERAIRLAAAEAVRNAKRNQRGQDSVSVTAPTPQLESNNRSERSTNAVRNPRDIRRWS